MGAVTPNADRWDRFETDRVWICADFCEISKTPISTLLPEKNPRVRCDNSVNIGRRAPKIEIHAPVVVPGKLSPKWESPGTHGRTSIFYFQIWGSCK